jgi:hypothetical protein
LRSCWAWLGLAELGLEDAPGLDAPVPPPTVPARIWPTLAFRFTGGAPGTVGVAGADELLALVVVVDEVELELLAADFWDGLAVLVLLARDVAVA